jgi:glutathione S-transferase
VGRILYALGYVVDPSKREMGFLIQFLASIVLLLGALGKAAMLLIAP